MGRCTRGAADLVIGGSEYPLEGLLSQLHLKLTKDLGTLNGAGYFVESKYVNPTTWGAYNDSLNNLRGAARLEEYVARLSGQIPVFDNENYGFNYQEKEAVSREFKDFLNSFDWKNASDKEKVTKILEKFTQTALDDNGTGAADGPYGCLVNKSATRKGFETTFLLLARLMGMECAYTATSYGIYGSAVKIDGRWYTEDSYTASFNSGYASSSFAPAQIEIEDGICWLRGMNRNSPETFFIQARKPQISKAFGRMEDDPAYNGRSNPFMESFADSEIKDCINYFAYGGPVPEDNLYGIYSDCVRDKVALNVWCHLAGKKLPYPDEWTPGAQFAYEWLQKFYKSYDWDDASDLEKAEYIFKYLGKNFSYAKYKDPYPFTQEVEEGNYSKLISNLVDNGNDCQSLANLYLILGRSVGLKVGYAGFLDGSHTFNLVDIDGEIYGVDASGYAKYRVAKGYFDVYDDIFFRYLSNDGVW